MGNRTGLHSTMGVSVEYSVVAVRLALLIWYFSFPELCGL